ncbi:hypothetical protein M0811_14341 [Anaeramoeba ignava]|uniref:Uncharacterized protein n=1 Tax=Anaeramoeba ignava TaxID=1746090 RepID=A0A9Q0LVN9_ANAIG|nr:hypothetical protein M0811_14341 [Anaeramoeba ignava]
MILDFYNFPKSNNVSFYQPFTSELRVSKKFKSDGMDNCTITASGASFEDVKMLGKTDLTLLEEISSVQSQIQLYGNLTATSDNDGIATFDNIQVIYGPSDTIRLIFSVVCESESELSPTGPAKSLITPLDNKTAITSYPLFVDTDVELLSLYNQSEVDSILDYFTLNNITFVVNSSNPDLRDVKIIPSVVRNWSYPEYEAFAYFNTQYPILNVDDDNFTTIYFNVSGSTTRDILFTAFCEGVEIDAPFNLKFNTTVSSITITNPQIKNGEKYYVEEGKNFTDPFIIKIEDSGGKGIAEKPVFAKIAMNCDYNISEYQKPLFNSKSLLNTIAITNSSGFANFSDLKFSVDGKTNSQCAFQIEFTSDGIYIITDNIYVNSSVKQIIPVDIVKNITISNTYILEANPRPLIQVLNENGTGIPGKYIEFHFGEVFWDQQAVQTDINGFGIFDIEYAWMSSLNGTYDLIIKVDDQNITMPNVTLILNFTEAPEYCSAINITNWNISVNSGDILNISFEILEFYGNLSSNSSDTFTLTAYIDEGELPMGYVILNDSIINNNFPETGNISIPIFGIQMTTMFCLQAKKNGLKPGDFDTCEGCYLMDLNNPIKTASVIEYNKTIHKGESWNNSTLTIEYELYENQSLNNTVTIHILLQSYFPESFDYQNVFNGTMDINIVYNTSTILYEFQVPVDNNSNLVHLEGFQINYCGTYNMAIFINGFPSSEISIQVIPPVTDFILTIDWNPGIVKSGYNKSIPSALVQANFSDGSLAKGYYIYAQSEDDDCTLLFDYDDLEQVGLIQSKTPLNSTGYTPLPLNFLFANNTSCNITFCIFGMNNSCDESSKKNFNISFEIDQYQIESFDIDHLLYYNQTPPIPPKVSVTDSSNVPQGNKSVFAMSIYKVLIDYAITDQNGTAIFNNFRLTEETDVLFVCDKSYSSIINFQVTREPTLLTVLTNPLETGAKIGIPFPLPHVPCFFQKDPYLGSAVVGLYFQSTPIPKRPIFAMINSNNGDGSLEEYSSVALTDNNGIAVFDFIMDSGSSGNYTIEFSYNDLRSETDPFYVSNPVTSVSTNYPKKKFNIGIGRQFPVHIQVNFDGSQKSKRVPIQILSQCSDASIVNSIPFTNENGECDITVQFDASSGDSSCLDEKDKVKASIAFSAYGIQSKYENFLIDAIDNVDLEAAKDSLNQSGIFWVICFTLAIPFILNSSRNHHILTYIVALILAAVLIAFLPQLIPKTDSTYPMQYVFLAVLEGVLVSFALLFILVIVVSKIFKKLKFYIENRSFINDRVSSYMLLFKRLLPLGAKRHLKILEMERKLIEDEISDSDSTTDNDDSDEKPKDNVGYIEEFELEAQGDDPLLDNDSDSSKSNQKITSKSVKEKSYEELTEREIGLILRRSVKNLELKRLSDAKAAGKTIPIEKKPKKKTDKFKRCWRGFVNLLKKIIKKIKEKFAKEDNPHEQYETYYDFYYPQRLLTAFWLWVIMSAILVLLITQLFRSITLSILWYRQEEIGKIQQSNCFDNKPVLSDYPPTSLSAGAALLIKSIDKQCNEDISALGNIWAEFIKKIPPDMISKVCNAFSVIMGIASFLAFIIMCVQWRSIFKLYRKRIMILRQGKTPFEEYEETDVSEVTSFTNLQIWLGLIAYVLAWLVTFFVLLVIPAVIWLMLYFLTKAILLRILLVIFIIILVVIFYQFVIIYLVQKLVKTYFIDDNTIMNRTVFSIYDFIKFFISIFSSATDAAKRLIGASGVSVSYSLFRLDLEGSMDSSYSAMMKIDHQTNNPILRVFMNYMMNYLIHLRKEIQKIHKNTFDITNEEISMTLSYFDHHPVTGEESRKEKLRRRFILLLTLATNKSLRKRGIIIRKTKRKKKALKKKEEKIWMMISKEERMQKPKKEEIKKEKNSDSKSSELGFDELSSDNDNKDKDLKIFKNDLKTPLVEKNNSVN